MVVVKKIQVLEKNYKNYKTESFKKCLKLVPNLLDLLPKNSKFKVSFELHDTNTDLANAIRRCILNEIEIYSMTFNEENMNISDPYILSDFIKKQIELIPILQDPDIDYDDLKIDINVKNNTNQLINITSKDINVYHKDKQKNIMTDTIILCNLRPMEFFNINNIYIKKGKGRNDAGAFNSVSNITYDILNIIPYDENNKKGSNSLISNPTSFEISYTTYRNIKKPFYFIKLCCDTLIKRLEIILNDMKNIKNDDIKYYSEILELETKNDLKILYIKNECRTIANLIARYCFILTKQNIKFISSDITHYEKDIVFIKIIHNEFSTLIQNSIKKIIDEIKNIKINFK
jgi:hypothetical protein